MSAAPMVRLAGEDVTFWWADSPMQDHDGDAARAGSAACGGGPATGSPSIRSVF